MRSSRSARFRMVVVGVAASLATLSTVSALAVADRDDDDDRDRGRTVTCQINLTAVGVPRALDAENFGTLTCSPLFGKGVQHDSSRVTRTSQLTGTFTGPYEQFFDNGKLFGTSFISYTVNPSTFAVTYTGTIDVDGGTGFYRGLRGRGTLTGFSSDAIKTTLTEVLRLRER